MIIFTWNFQKLYEFFSSFFLLINLKISYFRIFIKIFLKILLYVFYNSRNFDQSLFKIFLIFLSNLPSTFNQNFLKISLNLKKIFISRPHNFQLKFTKLLFKVYLNFINFSSLIDQIFSRILLIFFLIFLKLYSKSC